MGAFDDIIAAFGGGTPEPAPAAPMFQQIGALPQAGPLRNRDWDETVPRMRALMDQAQRKAMGDLVAQTRITRTPVYTVPREDWKEGTSLALYYPQVKSIQTPEGNLQTLSARILPHESAHDIFQKAGLGQSSAELLKGMTPSAGVMDQLRGYPGTYKLTPETVANEGLAYSVGDWGRGPFVYHVADQIKDPALADQLKRLHRNAVLTNERIMSPMEKFGQWIQNTFELPPILPKGK